MIVPCNTSVTVIIVFGGIPFFMFPKTYNIGAISTSGDTCVGGFSTAPTDTGEQDLLDHSDHESHVQQDSG
jgi:hypothetical protein